MGSMDELRSPSLPTRPAAPVFVFPSPSMLSVLQLLGTIRCPKKPRAAQIDGDTVDTVSQADAAEGDWTTRSVPLPDRGARRATLALEVTASCAQNYFSSAEAW